MTIPAILLPVFVQILLTFILMLWMARARFQAASRREVKIGDIALGQRNLPARAQQISNAFHNQLELPILFYVLVILAIATREADYLFVVLEWLFVLTRIVHAAIHTTSNIIMRRFGAFLAGALILMVMWIMFAAAILFNL